jgi:hypothetical protein
MATETLSVRVNSKTRKALAEAAASCEVAGASALAREILERWADERLAASTKASIARAARYLREHPDGWDDDPDSFFQRR